MSHFELVFDGKVLNVTDAFDIREAIEIFFPQKDVLIVSATAESATIIFEERKFVVRLHKQQ